MLKRKNINIVDALGSRYISNNHHQYKSRRLGTLLADPSFSDICFVVDGENIHGNRMLLRAASSYFDALLTSFREATSPTIPMHGVSADAFRLCIEFLHTSEAEDLTALNAEELLKIADMYQIDHLRILCFDVLEESIAAENVLHILRLTEQFDSTHLRAACTTYLKANFENVLKRASPPFDLRGMALKSVQSVCSAFAGAIALASHTKAASLSQELMEALVAWHGEALGARPQTENANAQQSGFDNLFQYADGLLHTNLEVSTTSTYVVDTMYPHVQSCDFEVDGIPFQHRTHFQSDLSACSAFLIPGQTVPWKPSFFAMKVYHQLTAATHTEKAVYKVLYDINPWTEDVDCEFPGRLPKIYTSHSSGFGWRNIFSREEFEAVQRESTFYLTVRTWSNSLWNVCAAWASCHVARIHELIPSFGIENLRQLFENTSLPVPCEDHVLDVVIEFTNDIPFDDAFFNDAQFCKSAEDIRKLHLAQRLLETVRVSFVSPMRMLNYCSRYNVVCKGPLFKQLLNYMFFAGPKPLCLCTKGRSYTSEIASDNFVSARRDILEWMCTTASKSY